MLSAIFHDTVSFLIMMVLAVTVVATVIGTIISIWFVLRSMDGAEASSSGKEENSDPSAQCNASATWMPLFLYGEYSTYPLAWMLYSGSLQKVNPAKDSADDTHI